MEDFLFNKNGVLTGVGESSTAHKKDILLLEKGWDKDVPYLGVGINSLQDDEISKTEIEARITEEFTTDGMRIKSIVVDGQNIKTNASY